MLASSNNSTDLVRDGSNMYAESGDSGNAIVGYADEQPEHHHTGCAGELERGPVEGVHRHAHRAAAFSRSARVITTSDEMLSELVQLLG